MALIISYVLVKVGLIPHFSGAQPIFGLPVGVHATAGGSVSIIVLQLVINLILAPILWYPWLRHADKKALAEEHVSE